jgi:glycosyltransferase involved in cell wall biosynthesis
VRFEISEGDLASYSAAADYLNASNVDLVCLQHEYGIFGGKSGNYIMELLKHLHMPVITTLHTVLREPNLDQRVVMHKIAARSERLIVMSQYSLRVLQEVFNVPAEKIELIPHGIPDLPFEQPDIYKKRLSCQGKSVLLTFGLLSPNKGFESAIRAMPSILANHSNVVYMIAGATHPHVRAREGDRYRLELQALAEKLGVERQVLFLNRFVSPEEMASLVGSADIYITPYCHEAQAVSGTLAYAMGAGKAIISTPYWYAAEVLDQGRGMLVPFENSAAIATATIALLANDEARQAMRERAYPITQAAVGLTHDRAELPAFAGSDLFEHVDLCSTTSGIHWTRHERDCPSFSDLAQKSAAKWTPQWTPKPLFCGHHGGHHGDKSLI